MAVVIETTLGDITVDLYLDQRPVTCLNFLKLCKMKYYNYNLFHSIRSGFIAQTGDPTGEGAGGESIWGILEGPKKRFFSGEKMPKIRHTEAGLLSMVCTDDMMVGSQFFFTLAPDLDSLDGTHCVIGEVTEGHEVLSKLNEVICDESHRPYRDVRITHTVVLEDPFNDPPGLRAPSRSPSPNAERLKGGRIAPDEEIDETEGKTAEEVQEMIEEKEAKARATILEIVGDLPDADIAPPENVLFVCKLNPVTTDDDLEIIFSRFGKIVSCEVIRDKKTGNSLQYAFIEFDNKKSCEDAYFKMDNVLIDDRRIHVDFSQSVSKMRWLGKGRGVQYFNDDKSEISVDRHESSNRSSSRDRSRQRHKDDRNIKLEDKKYEDSYRDRRHRTDQHNNIKSQRDRSRSRSRLKESRSHRSERGRGQSRDRDNGVSRDSHRRRNEYNGNEKSYKSNSSSSRTERKNNSPSPQRRSNVEYDKKNRSRDHSNRGRERSKNDERKKDDNNSISKTKSKSKVNDEPKTPSPIIHKKKEKSKDKVKHKQSKVVNKSKKKRKVSTSSSDSSSDSSSSTESSSSSDSDRKRKKKKRKYSTSSSSSSSSSSDSSSDTSSSSSNSEVEKKRRKKKVQSKKTSRKSKK